MAWNGMDYRCGHTEQVQLYGPMRDRDRRLELAKNNLDCPACYQARLQTERQAQNERAALLAADSLPALQGSEKQIAWATSIRQAWIEAMAAIGATQPELNTIAGLESSAQWWISSRSDGAQARLHRLAASYPTQIAEIKAAKAARKEGANAIA